MIFFFNLPGLGFLGFGVAAAVTADYFLGESYGSGPFTIALGLVSGATDLVYRVLAEDANLWRPSRGGHLFWIPVWVFGGFWITIGCVDLISGA